jgi:hypothetical protein
MAKKKTTHVYECVETQSAEWCSNGDLPHKGDSSVISNSRKYV